MRFKISSVLVDDQDKALAFSTEVLGFVKTQEIPLGDHRWLTVVVRDDQDGHELVLEPDEHPAVKQFKPRLMNDGISAASFACDDVAAEHARLQARGVRFTQEPLSMGPMSTAVFDDTCGNLIQIAVGPPDARAPSGTGAGPRINVHMRQRCSETSPSVAQPLRPGHTEPASSMAAPGRWAARGPGRPAVPVEVARAVSTCSIRVTIWGARTLRARRSQLDVRIEAVAVEQTGAAGFAGLGDEGIDLVLRLGRG